MTHQPPNNMEQAAEQVLTGIAGIITAIGAAIAAVLVGYKALLEARETARDKEAERKRVAAKDELDRQEVAAKLNVFPSESWNKMFAEAQEKADIKLDKANARIDTLIESNDQKREQIFELEQKYIVSDKQQQENMGRITSMENKIIMLEQDNKRLEEDNVKKQAEIDRLNQIVEELKQQVRDLGGEPKHA